MSRRQAALPYGSDVKLPWPPTQEASGEAAGQAEDVLCDAAHLSPLLGPLHYGCHQPCVPLR